MGTSDLMSFSFSFVLPATAFVAGLCYIANNPTLVTSQLPALYTIPPPSEWSLPIDISKILPSQLFDLGALSVTARNATGEALQTCLAKANEIVKGMTEQTLLNFGDFLKQAEKEQSFYQRVTGLFNFVNFMWTLSIFGVLIALGPVIYFFAAPLARLCTFLYESVLIPTYKVFRPVLAYLGFAISGLIVVQGLRYPAESAPSFFVSLTGIGGGATMLLWALYLYLPPSQGSVRGKQIIMAMTYSFVAAIFGILAPHFDSKLLSYISVAAVFSLLGFTIIPVPLGLYIGFESEDSLSRSVFASFLLTFTFVSLKAFALLPAAARVFSSPVSVLGMNVFFLGMLIASSKYYGRRNYNGENNWVIMQIRYVLYLLATIFLGHFVGMPGLVNVAYVYGVLFLMDKSAESKIFHHGSRIWLLVLSLSAVTYKLSLYLHGHPEILMGLVSALD